jgi:hypothetical protein
MEWRQLAHKLATKKSVKGDLQLMPRDVRQTTRPGFPVKLRPAQAILSFRREVNNLLISSPISIQPRPFHPARVLEFPVFRRLRISVLGPVHPINLRPPFKSSYQ